MAGRAPKILAVLGALALVQALAYVAFRRVERGRERTDDPAAFPSRRASGQAPDLTYALPDGTTRRLRDHRGRVVLVHFWASWCLPCRKELPELLALAGTLHGVDILAVSVDDDWAAVRTFVGGDPPATVVLAVGDDYKQFGVQILPDSYVVGPDGAFRARLEGARPWRSSAARAFLAAQARVPAP